MKEKINNLLGLAMKSGQLISGEELCKKAVQNRQVCLVLVAEDASDNTKKLFRDKTRFYEIPLRFYDTKENLGSSIGKLPRAVIAIRDQGFARKLMEYIDTKVGNE
ncbi:L7Ae/L30e/S12e/Gadd45 family ribosomal protein [Alkaliphilus crotonatoxidans]